MGRERTGSTKALWQGTAFEERKKPCMAGVQ